MKQLSLTRETLQALSGDQILQVAGGAATQPQTHCTQPSYPGGTRCYSQVVYNGQTMIVGNTCIQN